MASYSHISRRGQSPADNQQVSGRWLRHDARVSAGAVFAGCILLTLLTFAAIGLGSDMAQWWRGR